MNRIAVYCGSNSGFRDPFGLAARSLGELLATNGIDVVFGGGKVGLMGILAESALAAGGKVIGVIPRFLEEWEVAHGELSELHVVETMHERKAMINELVDGAVALPGGFGTLEELFEMLTWGQLGLHSKPVGILNTAGFYDHLLRSVEVMVDEGMLKASNKDLLLVSTDPEELLLKMESFQPPPVSKFIDPKTGVI